MSFKSSESKNVKRIGINTFECISINPSRDQAEKLGIKMDTDPQYVKDGKARIDCYMSRKDIPFPIKSSIWIEAHRASSKGNYPFLDKFGRKQWKTSLQELESTDFSKTGEDKDGNSTSWDTFDIDSCREALWGEIDLTTFLRNLISVPAKSEARLDNPGALLEGDFSELQGYISMFKSVVMGLGIKDEKYYQFYTGATRSTFYDIKKSTAELADIIEKDEYTKAYFGEHPFNWSTYTPGSEEYAQPVEEVPVVDKLPF